MAGDGHDPIRSHQFKKCFAIQVRKVLFRQLLKRPVGSEWEPSVDAATKTPPLGREQAFLVMGESKAEHGQVGCVLANPVLVRRVRPWHSTKEFVQKRRG